MGSQACDSPLVTKGEKIKFDYYISSPTLLKSPDKEEEQESCAMKAHDGGVVLSDEFQTILTKIGKRKSNVDEDSEFDRASQFESLRGSAQAKIKFMQQE